MERRKTEADAIAGKRRLMSEGKMSKSERVELTQLIRKRERVMKAHAIERSAAMLANFDQEIAKIYSYDDDEVWAKATREAEKAVAEANKKIAERCKALGIPPEFAPSIQFGWAGRGQNAVAGRRAELRRLAKSRIDHIEQDAKTKIERMSLEAQTEVVANGLESVAARAFLDQMPKLEAMMPELDVKEVQDEQEKQRRRLRW